MKINRLLLASTSPYRRALLKQVGIEASSQKPNCDEDSIHAPSPSELAAARSEAKGLSLDHVADSCLVLAGDQVLEFEGKDYGKAETEAEAIERLRSFSGKLHHLHSAYTLLHYDPARSIKQILCTRVISAHMHMRSLSEGEIRAYVATGEWQGCAGCYQYENRGMQLFDKVEGETTTIIGLPLPELLKDLRILGISPLLAPAGPWVLI